MKSALSAAAIFLLAGIPARAHRLDQYLQGTILAVEKNRVDVQITLTPGVAVFPVLLAEIDRNSDGVISAAEQNAYAKRVLDDLSLKMDDHALTPHLLSAVFPAIQEMKDGRGEIRIEFEASFPAGGPTRKLTLENHHQSRIAAYQVNCLVSRDPDIRILAQNRNYSQSFYELDFAQAGARANPLSFIWMGPIAIFLLAWVALLWRRPPEL